MQIVAGDRARCPNVPRRILLFNRKNAETLVITWANGIRTRGMQESKSCALPLGDGPGNN